MCVCVCETQGIWVMKQWYVEGDWIKCPILSHQSAKKVKQIM